MIRAFQAPMTRVERIGLIAGLALAAALMIPLRGYVTDDTYIHLQYARHLASRQGLVFNLGERVYGCTSPLWVTLIADGIAIGLDGLKVARALGVVATLASVALFLQLTRRTLRSPELRALATVTWAGHAWMLRWSTSGMETPLAVALTLAGFVAFTEGRQVGSRPIRTGALWALAALTRPELVFLLLIWCVTTIIDAHSRDGVRRLIFGMLPPAAIYGLWLLFARFYFGTFWPQTLSAKTAGLEGAAQHLAHLWRQARIVGATDIVLLGVLVLALLLGGRAVWRRPRLAQEVVPWLWVTALPALYMARNVPVVSRYLLVVLPILHWQVWRAAERWWLANDPSPAQMARATAAGMVICALALAENLAVYRAAVVPQVVSFSRALDQSLVRWGKWFARNTAPDAVIATPDIGAIGYFSNRRVLDLSGLVTPGMIPYLERETHDAAAANFRFASIARPAYIVDRADLPYDLEQRSPYASCLVPLGIATVPNLGIAHPVATTYTFYRVNWRCYDTRARR